MPERVQKNSSYLNEKSLTGTRTRVKDVSPLSGLCSLCIKECPFLCDVSLSAFRGREALYPDLRFFGCSTAGGLKDEYFDWSQINILPALIGAQGIQADSDEAIFSEVEIESNVGGVPLKTPIVIGAYGSTEVGRVNWEGLAIGAALSGIIITIGENICGMDPETKFQNGKVIHSVELKRRVDLFRKFWDGKYGDVVVQTNVEDQRLGQDVYALSNLEVNIIERKWGQGAKSIGGEVRLWSLERAKTLKKRGYIVIPDPEDKSVQEAFKTGVFRSFERHSRVGMPKERDFIEDVDWLRDQGAKQVFLKTGAYRPAAVAFTMKVASEAKIDAVTFDGAGGGTGMSPEPHMDEMGTPTIVLESQVLNCIQLLEKKGRHIPDIIIAGGFINESQLFKAVAMSNFGKGPYIKAVLMGRSPITATMKATYFTEDNKNLPKTFTDRFGDKPEQFFITVPTLKAKYGERFKEIPWSAVGCYTYLAERVSVGLQQLMAGVRKWKLNLIDRSDIASLTERTSKVTNIPLIENVDKDVFESILG